MSYDIDCSKVFAKESGFTKADLNCIKETIAKINGDIALHDKARIEKGVITKPSKRLFGIPSLEQQLSKFLEKLEQIKKELKSSPRSSKGSNGGANAIHTGPRGGKYMVRKNKTVYI